MTPTRSGPYYRDTAVHYLHRLLAPSPVLGAARDVVTSALDAAVRALDSLGRLGAPPAPDPGPVEAFAGAEPAGWLLTPAHLDQVPRFTRTPPVIHRQSLEDTDPWLLEELRTLGNKWGRLGVAVAAAHLTDPDVLVQALIAGDRPPATPHPHDGPLTVQDRTDLPGYSTAPGWIRADWRRASRGEFAGRLARVVSLSDGGVNARGNFTLAGIHRPTTDLGPGDWWRVLTLPPGAELTPDDEEIGEYLVWDASHWVLEVAELVDAGD